VGEGEHASPDPSPGLSPPAIRMAETQKGATGAKVIIILILILLIIIYYNKTCTERSSHIVPIALCIAGIINEQTRMS